MTIYTLDLEANGLLTPYTRYGQTYPAATQVWCAVVKEYKSGGETTVFSPEDIPQFKDWLAQLEPEDTLIGHNIISYDKPLIKKILGIDIKAKIIDTLVLSRVQFPDRNGGHSLENWMKILGGSNQKVQNDDWLAYYPVMLERCESDVRATEKVFQYLERERRD